MVKAKRATKKTPRPAETAPVRVALVPRRYSPTLLVEVYRWTKANPEGFVEINEYGGRRMTVPEWRAWLVRCLMDKINARDPRYGKGRKWSEEYATELARLKPYVGTRLAFRWVAPILGERVKRAMLARYEED